MKGIKGSFKHTLGPSCFLDVLKVILLLCTVWNHHWTTIWDNMFYFFLASNSRKSKKRKRKCHPTKSQAAAFAAFDAAQNNNEAAALRGVVWFETSWGCFLGSGGWWSELEELQGQLFIQTSQEWSSGFKPCLDCLSQSLRKWYHWTVAFIFTWVLQPLNRCVLCDDLFDHFHQMFFNIETHHVFPIVFEQIYV